MDRHLICCFPNFSSTSSLILDDTAKDFSYHSKDHQKKTVKIMVYITLKNLFSLLFPTQDTSVFVWLSFSAELVSRGSKSYLSLALNSWISIVMISRKSF